MITRAPSAAVLARMSTMTESEASLILTWAHEPELLSDYPDCRDAPPIDPIDLEAAHIVAAMEAAQFIGRAH